MLVPPMRPAGAGFEIEIPTGWPGVRTLADAAHRWIARNRLRLTGRAGACACEPRSRPAP
jgi:predicted DCC family thiol-disulfide oxidoreductase YuxK